MKRIIRMFLHLIIICLHCWTKLHSSVATSRDTNDEYKKSLWCVTLQDGKKIVTTTTIVTTDLNPMNMGELQNGLFESMEIPMNQPVRPSETLIDKNIVANNDPMK